MAAGDDRDVARIAFAAAEGDADASRQLMDWWRASAGHPARRAGEQAEQLMRRELPAVGIDTRATTAVARAVTAARATAVAIQFDEQARDVVARSLTALLAEPELEVHPRWSELCRRGLAGDAAAAAVALRLANAARPAGRERLVQARRAQALVAAAERAQREAAASAAQAEAAARVRRRRLLPLISAARATAPVSAALASWALASPDVVASLGQAAALACICCAALTAGWTAWEVRTGGWRDAQPRYANGVLFGARAAAGVVIAALGVPALAGVAPPPISVLHAPLLAGAILVQDSVKWPRPSR